MLADALDDLRVHVIFVVRLERVDKGLGVLKRETTYTGGGLSNIPPPPRYDLMIFGFMLSLSYVLSESTKALES